MQYLLLALTDEAGWLKLTKAEQEQGSAAFFGYVEALKTAGLLVGTYRPQPSSTAKTVRITDGKTQVLDGLSADTKELLTGLYIIDVPDLDAALSWAERNPAARFGVGVTSRAPRSSADWATCHGADFGWVTDPSTQSSIEEEDLHREPRQPAGGHLARHADQRLRGAHRTR